jgi:hypothetical protein
MNKRDYTPLIITINVFLVSAILGCCALIAL